MEHLICFHISILLIKDCAVVQHIMFWGARVTNECITPINHTAVNISEPPLVEGDSLFLPSLIDTKYKYKTIISAPAVSAKATMSFWLNVLGVLFENRPALYFCNYIFIIAYKMYIFLFRIKDTV